MGDMKNPRCLVSTLAVRIDMGWKRILPVDQLPVRQVASVTWWNLRSVTSVTSVTCVAGKWRPVFYNLETDSAFPWKDLKLHSVSSPIIFTTCMFHDLMLFCFSVRRALCSHLNATTFVSAKSGGKKSIFTKHFVELWKSKLKLIKS